MPKAATNDFLAPAFSGSFPSLQMDEDLDAEMASHLKLATEE
jgi:hypothetical protein